ncbi:MAG: hypothetical protein LBH44_06535 [Treponema sp.]|jgi:internalin A|nr:hypothetical protein [Treponema sp.]
MKLPNSRKKTLRVRFYLCYYALSFLIAVTLCSCVGKKTNGGALPVASETVTSENEPDIIAIENSNIKPQPFRSFSNGTYYHVTDLSDLLAYIDDPTIKSLDLYAGDFSDLSPLAMLTELEELYIQSNIYVTDISPLKSLTNLKKLDLFGLPLESIEPISSLVNLRHLELAGYKDCCFKELLPLKRLETLRLVNRTTLDATYIAQLQSLTKLSYTPGAGGAVITNIEQLRKLINLKDLAVVGVDLDISWITYLQNLESLAFSGCIINDISPLAKLPNLIDVELYQSEVRDITPLLESKSIKKISEALLPCFGNDDGAYERRQTFETELQHRFRERGIELSFYYPYR